MNLKFNNLFDLLQTFSDEAKCYEYLKQSKWKDGGGYKKQAETWLRNQIDAKLTHVFNMMEFQKWANKDKI